MKIATFKTKVGAEKLVKLLREKLPKFGFEVALEPAGFKFAVKVFSAEGKFLAYCAACPRALIASAA